MPTNQEEIIEIPREIFEHLSPYAKELVEIAVELGKWRIIENEVKA